MRCIRRDRGPGRVRERDSKVLKQARQNTGAPLASRTRPHRLTIPTDTRRECRLTCEERSTRFPGFAFGLSSVFTSCVNPPVLCVDLQQSVLHCHHPMENLFFLSNNMTPQHLGKKQYMQSDLHPDSRRPPVCCGYPSTKTKARFTIRR